MPAKVKLPSGDEVLSLTASDAQPMEATAGAMSLDVEGKCPKCGSAMGMAIADTETVYYCDRCRVALPLPAQPTE